MMVSMVMSKNSKNKNFITKYRDMKASKYEVRGVARSAALSFLSALQRKKAEDCLRFIYCHYVFDDQISSFFNILSSLKGIGQFVDTDTAINMVKGLTPIKGRNFHISFDDGFKNNFTNAVPVLNDLNIKALFFVPTKVIGSTYEITEEYCLVAGRYGAVMELMSWSDLREMANMGHAIGSHTRTHKNLSQISLDDKKLRSEIIGSKNDIENEVGSICRAISWPYGKMIDFDERSLMTVVEAGYDACFSACRGTVSGVSHRSLYTIPRHHFEPQWSVRHVEFFAHGNLERS